LNKALVWYLTGTYYMSDEIFSYNLITFNRNSTSCKRQVEKEIAWWTLVKKLGVL